MITSECVNMLNKRIFKGSIALKVGIRKASNSMHWEFIFEVMKRFGFSKVFCSWISNILCSAYISILINVLAKGYFSCSFGVL